jgi:hypothetical protein
LLAGTKVQHRVEQRTGNQKKGKKGETEKNRLALKCGRVGLVIIIIKSRQI